MFSKVVKWSQVVKFGAPMLALTFVLGGCSFLPRAEGPSEPSKDLWSGTRNEWLLEIGTKVPEFGGMFLDENGVLNIYLTVPTTAALKAAEGLIYASTVMHGLPRKGVKAIQAQYTIKQLYTWYKQLHHEVWAISGVNHTTLHDAKNRIFIGVENISVAEQIKQKAVSLGIPPEALIISEMPAVKLLSTTLHGHFRPIRAGFQHETRHSSGLTLNTASSRNCRAAISALSKRFD